MISDKCSVTVIQHACNPAFMLAFDLSHYSCVDKFLIIDCKALNFLAGPWITTNHALGYNYQPLGYNYQPGSYTPVKPFEPPMHALGYK